MATKAKASVTPLDVIEEAAAFEGFSPEDFAIFEVPDFAERMPRLRERIKPKLSQVGEALAPRLSEAMGEALYPHVAQHQRRTINPPEETWVAFARSPRAYKPFVHLRVAINMDKVRVVVFVEDDAEDKPRFAANLARNADALAQYLAHHPAIRAYDIPDADGEPQFGSALDAETLRAFAERLNRVKAQHAAFGLQFDKAHPVLQSGTEFTDAVVEAAITLKPLYDCGAISNFTFTYVPEGI